MPAPAPILCAHLLGPIDAELCLLLRDLSPEDWERPTIAGSWLVRDVAAHLLDTQLRKLSLVRDRCFVEKPEIRSNADLVAFINRINREGVTVYRRLSPAILVPLLEWSGRESAAFHQSLDPFAPAAFPVSWAGESASPNWFDTARELTERWHHQQQIRLAVNRPGLMEREFYHPVLDCFLRALPHAYRDTVAPPATRVEVEITGEAGGTWSIIRDTHTWRLETNPTDPAACLIRIPQSIAWRLFTKGIDRRHAESQLEITGDPALAQPVLQLTAIVG